MFAFSLETFSEHKVWEKITGEIMWDSANKSLKGKFFLVPTVDNNNEWVPVDHSILGLDVGSTYYVSDETLAEARSAAMDVCNYTEELLTDLQELQKGIVGMEDIVKERKKAENIKKMAEKLIAEGTIEEQIKENVNFFNF